MEPAVFYTRARRRDSRHGTAIQPFSAWQGSIIRWRIGILRDDGALDDLSGITGVALNIVSYGGTKPGETPWVLRTVPVADFTTPPNANTVMDGTAWHAEVALSSEEMTLPVEDSGSRTYWFEWRALTAAGAVILAAGQLVVRGIGGTSGNYARTAEVNTESLARAAADSAEAQLRAIGDAAETAARIAAITTESATREAADTAEALARAAADAAESAARQTAVSAEAAARTAAVGNLTTAVTSLSQSMQGLQVGDAFRVANVADLPATANGTGATRFAEVYADGASTANNGRYWQAAGATTWAKVAGDVTGRVSTLETFSTSATARLPAVESHTGKLQVWLDANRRPMMTQWDDGTTSLRLNADSIPTIGRANLGTDVQSALPATDDYNDVLWLLKDPTGRPLLYFRGNGRAVLRLDDGTIAGATLADGSLTTAKYADGSIPRAKLATEAQAAFPSLDDYNGILWILRDANGRPLMYFDSDGTLKAKIAGTQDTAQLRTDVGHLQGWCWGENNMPNAHLRLARIKAGFSERFVWATLGDSRTAHPGRFCTPALKLLQGEYGGSACGYFGFSYHVNDGNVNGCSDRAKAHGSADTAWVRDSTTPGGVYSPEGTYVHSATVGTWVEINVFTAQPSPKLYFRRRPGGGSIRWQVDGGAWTSVSTDGSDSFASVLVTIPFAACVIRVEVETAGTNGVTLMGLNFESATGAVVHKLARSGSQASEFTAGLNKAFFQSAMTALGPHLVSFHWGTNEQYYNADPAAMAGHIITLLTWVREVLPLCDCLIICPTMTKQESEGHAYGIRQYRDALRAAAIANRTAFLDLVEVWGDYSKVGYSADGSTLNYFTSDGIHDDPNRGALVTADAAYKLITKRV
ncbi:MAG: SGNH/GDSL hydrolase family protein [Verrucomicrobiaceae bacterium]|nr:MAG: SGNH/GDSL hydrolase family protein [Verrucomicrobiaceae bacterium]